MNHGFNRRIATVAAFTVAALGILAWPASTQNDGQTLKTEMHRGHKVVAGEALVKFRGAPALDQVERDMDADRDEKVGGAGLRLVHSRTHDVDTLLSILWARADVEFAEPNWIVYAAQTPADPWFGSLWGLYNTGQIIGGVAGTAGADIDAPQAWEISTGSTANVVGVVDTGIDYTHPDLAANVWSAPNQFTVTVGSRQITCAAGTHGFNAITNTCDPMDDNNHGTHVSGTIGAVGNNGVGVVGVNWVAAVMGLKFLDKNGSGTTANAINAIEFAVQAKNVFLSAANLRVLSNSWGGGGASQALLDEINRANTSDMLFVAAAGNSGSNNDATAFYPANYSAPNVVAVAATDNRDALASFSNYGATTVDLGAPGVYVLSTIRSGQYAYYSGTSMATPHVSGAAALVLSACTLDTTGVRNALLSNVDSIPSLVTKTVTTGRLNVFKAISNCGGSPPPPPPAPQDFTVGAAPGSVNVKRGGSAIYTVTVGSVGGFSGPVDLVVTGIPQGAAYTFSQDPVTPPAGNSVNSTLTVRTTSSSSRGTYTLTISGTGNPNGASTTNSATVSLRVR